MLGFNQIRKIAAERTDSLAINIKSCQMFNVVMSKFVQIHLA